MCACRRSRLNWNQRSRSRESLASTSLNRRKAPRPWSATLEFGAQSRLGHGGDECRHFTKAVAPFLLRNPHHARAEVILDLLRLDQGLLLPVRQIGVA